VAVEALGKKPRDLAELKERRAKVPAGVLGQPQPEVRVGGQVVERHRLQKLVLAPAKRPASS
jgi:hypothetical protein